MEENFIAHLFKNFIPNPEVHARMQPSYRGEYASNCVPKQSAVLVILFYKNNQLHVIYTKRTDTVGDKHRGQISFPGGGVEPTDLNLQHTALRETSEEIGVQLLPNHIIGELSPLYIPVSNYLVTPYVAIVNELPIHYVLQQSEVSQILEIPISHLLHPLTVKSKLLIDKEQEITIPYYEWNIHHIWGATAMITAELLEVLK